MTFDLNDDLIFLIGDCHRLLRNCFDRKMLEQSRDITFGDARSLALIAAMPDLRQGDIAAYHRIEPVSANGLLLRLESRNLIERRSDSADRRAKRIRITENGRKVLSEMSCVETNTTGETGILSGGFAKRPRRDEHLHGIP